MEKKKTVKTIKALKTRLKKSLPSNIAKVMDSYEDFLEKEVPDDAKSFGAHHAACKSAVAHAETLLKLARWTNDEVTEAKAEENDDDIFDIIAEAKEEKDEEDEN